MQHGNILSVRSTSTGVPARRVGVSCELPVIGMSAGLSLTTGEQ